VLPHPHLHFGGSVRQLDDARQQSDIQGYAASGADASSQAECGSGWQVPAFGCHSTGSAGGVYCFPLDEEVPHGIVLALHWCYPSDLVLPEEMPSTAKLSVEGTLVGADWPSAVPGQPGTDAGQEVQHIPFVATGSEHI